MAEEMAARGHLVMAYDTYGRGKSCLPAVGENLHTGVSNRLL